MFDFSHFHPTTHRIGSRRCRELPGGPRLHFYVWRTFTFQWPWAAAYHAVRCRLGKHEMLPVYLGSTDGPPANLECVWCPAQKAYTPPRR